MPKELTNKQQAFIEHYTKDPECKGNGTESAKRAGYKGNRMTLQSVAKENLLKPLIKQAVEAARVEMVKQIEVTVEFIVQKLLNGLSMAEVRGDLVSMARFSELLGRYKAMFTDKYQDTGQSSLPALTPVEQERYKLIAKNLSKPVKEA